MSDLISVKLSKKDREQDVALDAPMYEQYPYGMRLSFNPDISDRFPVLKSLGADEAVAIVAEGKVSEIRVNDIPGNSSRTVEIQITGIQLVSKEDYDAAFDDATNK
jgi:hypothetical protein